MVACAALSVALSFHGPPLSADFKVLTTVLLPASEPVVVAPDVGEVMRHDSRTANVSLDLWQSLECCPASTRVEGGSRSTALSRPRPLSSMAQIPWRQNHM